MRDSFLFRDERIPPRQREEKIMRNPFKARVVTRTVQVPVQTPVDTTKFVEKAALVSTLKDRYFELDLKLQPLWGPEFMPYRTNIISAMGAISETVALVTNQPLAAVRFQMERESAQRKIDAGVYEDGFFSDSEYYATAGK